MHEILRTSEFEEWMAGLDVAANHRVDAAIRSMSRGNWGDYKPLVGVAGVFERRLMGRGPGIRLYFCRQGPDTVLLLTGGYKASQLRRDINQAQRLRDQYSERST